MPLPLTQERLMTLDAATPAMPSKPAWLWASGLLGLAWNAYGVVQFAGSVRATPTASSPWAPSPRRP